MSCNGDCKMKLRSKWEFGEARIAELERRGRKSFRGILCSVADPKAVDAMLDEIKAWTGEALDWGESYMI